MIWVTLYIIIACCFVPFTTRYLLNRLEYGSDALDLTECFLGLFAGVIAAFFWFLVIAAWLLTRGRT